MTLLGCVQDLAALLRDNADLLASKDIDFGVVHITPPAPVQAYGSMTMEHSLPEVVTAISGREEAWELDTSPGQLFSFRSVLVMSRQGAPDAEECISVDTSYVICSAHPKRLKHNLWSWMLHSVCRLQGKGLSRAGCGCVILVS